METTQADWRYAQALRSSIEWYKSKGDDKYKPALESEKKQFREFAKEVVC